MRIDQPNVLLRNLFGSNPTLVNEHWLSYGVTPHVDTFRVSYEVPAGKRLLVNYVSLTFSRATIATAIGRVYALVYMGYDGLEKVYTSLIMHDMAVGAQRHFVSNPNLILNPSMWVSIHTMDSHTGGTIDYAVSFGGVLIDY